MTSDDALAKTLLELDTLLGHPTRFAIVTVLFALGPMTIGDLAKALRLSYGPLSTHLRRLEEAGYVEHKKVLTLKGPRTLVSLTPEGARAYVEHVEKLKSVIGAVMSYSQERRRLEGNRKGEVTS